jgi:hypothetical protein
MAKKKAKPKKAATKTAKPKKAAMKTAKPKKVAARTAKPTKAAAKKVKPKKVAARTVKPKKAGSKIRPKPVPVRKKPIPKKPAAEEPIVAPIATPPSEDLAAQEQIVEPADMPTPREMEKAEAAMTEPVLEELFGGGEERDGVLIDYEVETIVEVDVHRLTRPENDEEADRPTQAPPEPLPIPPTQAE